MNDYRSFDQLRTNELSVIRHGFWRPWFELSDGLFCYGKLRYEGVWKPAMILEADKKTWIIKRKGLFSRVMLIYDTDGMEAGTVMPEVWSGKIKLSLNNGFEAVYLNKKLFTRTFSLISSQGTDLLNIKAEVWKLKTLFKVFIEPDALKRTDDLPLLTLLGINLILLRRKQAAAAAGGG